jgi:hypothetical protein
MCICVNCYFVDRCSTYHAVETQHQQNHVEPTINVNIRTKDDYIEMEWDVVGCHSFLRETGKWALLRPGEPIPT